MSSTQKTVTDYGTDLNGIMTPETFEEALSDVRAAGTAGGQSDALALLHHDAALRARLSELDAVFGAAKAYLLKSRAPGTDLDTEQYYELVEAVLAVSGQ